MSDRPPLIVLRGLRAFYRSMRDIGQRRKLEKRARELRNVVSGSSDPANYWAALRSFDEFRAWQKEAEIVRLLELVRELEPSRLCEIGAAGGGTSFLLSCVARDDATLICVDTEFPRSRRRALQHLAKPGQRIVCLEGDSHTRDTENAVREILNGEQLDLLFIDGDHSYAGVAADFDTYGQMVRRGGIVVFHDVVPDFQMRFNIATGTDVGDVPRFWQALKSQHATVLELVEDPDQDGYGIGILRWDCRTSPLPRWSCTQPSSSARRST